MLLDKNNNFVLDNERHYIDICEYKNCRLPVEKSWVVCEKHIIQRQKDLKKIRLNKLNKFLGIL